MVVKVDAKSVMVCGPYRLETYVEGGKDNLNSKYMRWYIRRYMRANFIAMKIISHAKDENKVYDSIINSLIQASISYSFI